jgi:hypothetical protein
MCVTAGLWDKYSGILAAMQEGKYVREYEILHITLSYAILAIAFLIEWERDAFTHQQ